MGRSGASVAFGLRRGAALGVFVLGTSSLGCEDGSCVYEDPRSFDFCEESPPGDLPGDWESYCDDETSGRYSPNSCEDNGFVLCDDGFFAYRPGSTSRCN